MCISKTLYVITGFPTNSNTKAVSLGSTAAEASATSYPREQVWFQHVLVILPDAETCSAIGIPLRQKYNKLLCFLTERTCLYEFMWGILPPLIYQIIKTCLLKQTWLTQTIVCRDLLNRLNASQNYILCVHTVVEMYFSFLTFPL